MSALLAADYYDRGSIRTIDVLEELRAGVLRKLEQQMTIRGDLDHDDAVFACDVRMATYKTLIDDIAVFIQREQHNGR